MLRSSQHRPIRGWGAFLASLSTPALNTSSNTPRHSSRKHALAFILARSPFRSPAVHCKNTANPTQPLGRVEPPPPFATPLQNYVIPAKAGIQRGGANGNISRKAYPHSTHEKFCKAPLAAEGQGEGDRGGQKGGVRETTTNEHFGHHVNLPMFKNSAVSQRLPSAAEGQGEGDQA